MFFVFCLMIAIVVLWVVLMASTLLSLRWSRRDSGTRVAVRLIMAIVPVLIGYFLATFHLRFSMDGSSVNVSRPFVLPVISGIVATACWLLAQRRPRA